MFIQVKNLTKTFNNNPAVSDISFDIKKNQTVGLLGPNGCGKTTSIGMMLGLIKPSGGEIIIDNKIPTQGNGHFEKNEERRSQRCVELETSRNR